MNAARATVLIPRPRTTVEAGTVVGTVLEIRVVSGVILVVSNGRFMPAANAPLRTVSLVPRVRANNEALDTRSSCTRLAFDNAVFRTSRTFPPFKGLV